MNILNRDELIHHLKSTLTKFFEDKGLDFVYLGGSWVREKQMPWSDIDIFISLDSRKYDISESFSRPELNLMILQEKMIELSNLLQIQCSILESLPIHVQFDVIHDGIVLYEKSRSKRHDFVEHLLPKYYDFMIWYKRLLEESLI